MQPTLLLFETAFLPIATEAALTVRARRAIANCLSMRRFRPGAAELRQRGNISGVVGFCGFSLVGNSIFGNFCRLLGGLNCGDTLFLGLPTRNLCLFENLVPFVGVSGQLLL